MSLNECVVHVIPVIYQSYPREKFTKGCSDVYLGYSCLRNQYRAKCGPHVNWLIEIVKSEFTLKFEEKYNQGIEDNLGRGVLVH